MKQEADENAVKITQQFRSRDSMVYDLRGSAGRLTLRVSGREADGGRTEWRIEASTSTAPGSVSFAHSATTRAEALRAVGRSWMEKRVAHDLPSFDWDAVARALADVRAI